MDGGSAARCIVGIKAAGKMSSELESGDGRDSKLFVQVWALQKQQRSGLNPCLLKEASLSEGAGLPPPAATARTSESRLRHCFRS